MKLFQHRHRWHRLEGAFGYQYDPAWTGGEGPPPIIASWKYERCRCGEQRQVEYRAYGEPQQLEQAVVQVVVVLIVVAGVGYLAGTVLTWLVG